jgi:hypothetical protein
MKECSIIGRQMNALLRHMTIGLSCRIKVQFSTDVNSCTLEMICFVPSTKHHEIPKEGKYIVRLDFAVDQFWLNTDLFYSSSQFCLRRRSACFEKGEKKNQHWILGMSYMFV